MLSFSLFCINNFLHATHIMTNKNGIKGNGVSLTLYIYSTMKKTHSTNAAKHISFFSRDSFFFLFGYVAMTINIIQIMKINTAIKVYVVAPKISMVAASIICTILMKVYTVTTINMNGGR